MPTPRRAAIYARYSTELQRDASIEDQIRACRTQAGRQGYEVVKIYFDRAASGARLIRPGIQSLLQDAREARTFDIVLAHALDRLSRNCRPASSASKPAHRATTGAVSLRSSVILSG
ncbi:recombinase family protein [Rhodovulum sulfidophilum]|nr:recombinase family protein [Rhodovulum sulfidophilum]MCE8467513.1 recombinase family protein [Rhodovulum sulfidophilum]